MSKQFRQGDLWLVPVDKLPDNLKEAPRNANGLLVLAVGEKSGHGHGFLPDTAVTGFYRETAEAQAAAMPDYILVGGAGATLRDLDMGADKTRVPHDPIELPAQAYKVVRQQEADVNLSEFDQPMRHTRAYD